MERIHGVCSYFPLHFAPLIGLFKSLGSVSRLHRGATPSKLSSALREQSLVKA